MGKDGCWEPLQKYGMYGAMIYGWEGHRLQFQSWQEKSEERIQFDR